MLKTLLSLFTIALLPTEVLGETPKNETPHKGEKESKADSKKDDAPKTDTSKKEDPNQPQINLTLYRNGTAVGTKRLHLALKTGRQNVVYEGAPKTIELKTLMSSFDNTDASAQVLSQSIADDATSLNFEIMSTHEQTKLLNLIYTFSGLDWDVHYSAILSTDQKTLSLTGMIELSNHCGIDFKQAQVLFNGSRDEHSNDGSNLVNNTNEAFNYLLPRIVTLPSNKKQYLDFLSVKEIPLTQDNIVQVGGDYLNDQKQQTQEPPIQRVVQFKNNEATGFSFTLPEGKITLYQERTSGLNELLGTSILQETRTGQSVPLRMASDQGRLGVSCTLEQTDYKKAQGKSSESGYRVVLTNKNDAAVNVKVVLAYADNQCTIVRHSHPFEVDSTSQVHWDVEVPGNQTVELKYRVKIDGVR